MSKEKPLYLSNGYVALALVILMILLCVALFIGGIFLLEQRNPLGGVGMAAAIFLFACTMISCNGFVTLLPNEACVLTLFGSYSGSARESGFWWTNPFMTKRKLSLRSRNLEGGKLKVNDKQGNPIEIAAVVVWQIADTAQRKVLYQDIQKQVLDYTPGLYLFVPKIIIYTRANVRDLVPNTAPPLTEYYTVTKA